MAMVMQGSVVSYIMYYALRHTMYNIRSLKTYNLQLTIFRKDSKGEEVPIPRLSFVQPPGPGPAAAVIQVNLLRICR